MAFDFSQIVFCLISASLALGFPLTGHAMPLNPRVISGSATFETTGNELTITAASGTVIEWDAFDVGTEETVNVISSSTINNVIFRLPGTSASQIQGTLIISGGLELQVGTFNFHDAQIIVGSPGNPGSLILSAGEINIAQNTTQTFIQTGSGLADSVAINGGSINIFGPEPNGSASSDGSITLSNSFTNDSFNTGNSGAATICVNSDLITHGCLVTNSISGTSPSSALILTNASLEVVPTLATGLRYLVSGWNLLGNDSSQGIEIASVFADPAKFHSAWKWQAETQRFAFYAPGLNATELASAAAKLDCDVLTTIESGEGFWVNAKQDTTVVIPRETIPTTAALSPMLKVGWNLITSRDAPSPSIYHQSLMASEPPGELHSLWAWDNAQSTWYFYSPALAAQGAAALEEYASRHGFLDFAANGRLLRIGEGFWIELR